MVKKNYKKNNVWKPPLYTPKELKAKADEYFKYCQSVIINRWINWKIHKPFTISWFNLFAWISKNYLSEVAKKDEYLGTVEYIRNFIENDVEEKALIWVYSPSASSFNLKNNFGWSEKTETTLSWDLNIWNINIT